MEEIKKTCISKKKVKKYSKCISPVIEQVKMLIDWVLPKLGKFPRDQRFLLADRIERNLLDILELLIEAFYAPERRSKLLYEANIKLDVLRYLSRISCDNRYFDIKSHNYFCLKIDEIGNMVGGWKKQWESQEGKKGRG